MATYGIRCGYCEKIGHHTKDTCPQKKKGWPSAAAWRRNPKAAAKKKAAKKKATKKKATKKKATKKKANYPDVKLPTNATAPKLNLDRAKARKEQLRAFAKRTRFLHKDLLAHGGQWDETANAVLRKVKHCARYSSALRILAVLVHRASNHRVYIGRTTPDASGLRSRLSSHKNPESTSRGKGANFICPVITLSKKQAQDEDWEGEMIKWAKGKGRRLCVSLNEVEDGRGQWPKGNKVLIYICAGRKRRR
ncbi:MAG: hypothetical protein JKY65_19705 [Planctomycetes bacterium]|nr:hypothetical protein [Planctomycetota bacterium]